MAYDAAVAIGGIAGAVIVGGAYVGALLVLDRDAAANGRPDDFNEGLTYGEIALLTWFVPTSLGALAGGIVGHELFALDEHEPARAAAEPHDDLEALPPDWHD